MKILLLSIAALGVTLFVLALQNQAYGYWFVWPFLLLAAASAGCSLDSLFRSGPKGAAYRPALVATLLLFPASVFALLNWPGGDDGGGMGWVTKVVPLSLVPFILAVGLVIVGYIRKRQHKKAEGGTDVA